MSYRALRIARGDAAPLAGFEQDDYARNANFSKRTLADLLQEFATVRESTLAFLRSLDAQAWDRRGTANKNEISVRALAFVIAGTNSITGRSWKKNISVLARAALYYYPAAARGCRYRRPHTFIPLLSPCKNQQTNSPLPPLLAQDENNERAGFHAGPALARRWRF